MRLGMILRQRQITALKCEICGSYESEGHKEECPVARLDELVNLQVHIPCPKCRDGRISVNKSDFYECRGCHTQFTCGYGTDSDSPEQVCLDDPRRDDLVICNVLLRPGKGEFKYDETIESLRRQIEESRNKR